MPTRVAESIYTVGALVERADACALVVDADRARADGTDAASLAAAVVDRARPDSIAAAFAGAREHARRARGMLGADVREALDATRARMPRKVVPARLHEFLSWTRERASLITGIVEASAARDDAYHLFTLGRASTRALVTVRTLAERAPTVVESGDAAALLRACGALETFRARGSGEPTLADVERLLLLDDGVPHGLPYTLASMDRALTALRLSRPPADGSEPRLPTHLTLGELPLIRDAVALRVEGAAASIREASSTLLQGSGR
jgi:uncharacterized alpha-E superfamily protein